MSDFATNHGVAETDMRLVFMLSPALTGQEVYEAEGRFAAPD